MAMSRDDLGVCHIETRHWQAMFRGICVKHRQTYGIANTDSRNEIRGRGGHPTHHRHLQPRDSHHPLDSFMSSHHKFMLYLDRECTEGFMSRNTTEDTDVQHDGKGKSRYEPSTEIIMILHCSVGNAICLPVFYTNATKHGLPVSGFNVAYTQIVTRHGHA